eukprot:g4386.t1
MGISFDAFERELKEVMVEYEIDDISEGIEETIDQLTENGMDLSDFDAAAFLLQKKNTLSKNNEFNAPASLPRLELPTSISNLCDTLCDYTKPIGMRMRSLFYLRTVGGKEAIAAICKALEDSEHNNSLLRHELAFVLGQMGASDSVPVLKRILRDKTNDPMTRHEAAEAIGAIALPDSKAVLEQFKNDTASEVADTCLLALDRMAWKEKVLETANSNDMSLFNSVDPAPALTGESFDTLCDILRDETLPLFRRYGALFALRDSNTDEATAAIANALDEDRSSALFRHEVAYVCGQLERPVATNALTRALERSEENVMVRHEAAEALGAIGTPECTKVLEAFSKDKVLAVAESCIVALDVVNYWATSGEEEKGNNTLRKSEAAAYFAKPLQCSCASRVVPRT